MKLPQDAQAALIELAEQKGVRLEGAILKAIDVEYGDIQFIDYIKESIERDQESRRKRLEIMKEIQLKNKELLDTQDKLKLALSEAENAKKIVMQDLELLQKKNQFHMMRKIVNLSIGVVATVGLVATAVYVFALIKNREVERVGTVWASLTGILLTNSFSILGTIMGVKYAGSKED